MPIARRLMAVGVAAPPFTPASISGLRFRIDGATVTSWADLVAGNNGVPHTTPARPVYRASAVNGLGAVEFAGGQSLDFPIASLISAKDTYTLVTVTHPTDFNSYPIMMTYPISSGWSWIVEYDTNGNVYWGHQSGAYNLYNAAVPLGSWPILAMTKLTANTAQFKNTGNVISSFSTLGGGMLATPTMTGSIRLGAYWDDQYGVTGHIAEMLYWDRSLNSTEMEKVEGYLAWKWGQVANLPSGHPYKGAAP